MKTFEQFIRLHYLCGKYNQYMFTQASTDHRRKREQQLALGFLARIEAQYRKNKDYQFLANGSLVTPLDLDFLMSVLADV